VRLRRCDHYSDIGRYLERIHTKMDNLILGMIFTAAGLYIVRKIRSSWESLIRRVERWEARRIHLERMAWAEETGPCRICEMLARGLAESKNAQIANPNPEL